MCVWQVMVLWMMHITSRRLIEWSSFDFCNLSWLFFLWARWHWKLLSCTRWLLRLWSISILKIIRFVALLIRWLRFVWWRLCSFKIGTTLSDWICTTCYWILFTLVSMIVWYIMTRAIFSSIWVMWFSLSHTHDVIRIICELILCNSLTSWITIWYLSTFTFSLLGLWLICDMSVRSLLWFNLAWSSSFVWFLSFCSTSLILIIIRRQITIKWTSWIKLLFSI